MFDSEKDPLWLLIVFILADICFYYYWQASMEENTRRIIKEEQQKINTSKPVKINTTQSLSCEFGCSLCEIDPENELCA